jgi:hypothetical protein
LLTGWILLPCLKKQALFFLVARLSVHRGGS